MTNKYKQYSRVPNVFKRIHGGKCIRKKQFPDADSAQKFADDRGYKQKAYKCHFCPCWHLKSVL